jgi:hypothetical protein
MCINEDILQYRSGLSVDLAKPVITSERTLNPEHSRFQA